MSAQRTVLLTGAAGRIGTCLRQGLGGEYDLRLLDRRPIADPGSIAEAKIFIGNLTDYALMRRAMEEVDTLVHLAASPGDAHFSEALVPNNVAGVYNAFEAARDAGVRRIVFASTCQVVTGYPSGKLVEVDDPPCPLSIYGATKALGESMGGWFHDKHGMEFVAVRIGWFINYDDPMLVEREDAPRLWLSPRDTVRLFRAAVEAPGVGFATVFGTSKLDNPRLSLRTARELLGYEPMDELPAGQ